MSFSDDPREPPASAPLPRGPTSQPYRGPVRVRRSDGQREVWVEGEGYVPEGSRHALTADEQRIIREAQMAASEARSVLPDLDRFMELNSVQRTGSFADIIGGLGNQAPYWDTEAQEMHAITDRLAPLMRRPGSGASSDMDVTMYRSSLPNIRRGGIANQNITQQLRRNAQDLQDYGEFLDWYATRNRTLTGALEQFNRYLAQGRTDQRPSWREYFRAEPPQNPSGGSPQPSQGRPDPLGIR